LPYDPRLDSLLLFFDAEVLAAYRERPDRYLVVTDQFSGSVELADLYYMSLDGAAREREAIHVRFGYRTLNNGELRIAAFGPDLLTKSRPHIERWRPFRVEAAEWLDYDQDERFSSWVRRYIEADWGVDNGPAFYLLRELTLINGLSREAVGHRLFRVDEAFISFPTAQNTHRYEDAHRDLYGLLIDGVDKDCVRRLADKLGRSLDVSQMRSLNALKAVFPVLKAGTTFEAPLDNVSKQRALSSHGARPPAVPMRAFEAFSRDVDACRAAAEMLRRTLESELHLDAEHSLERQEALDRLPRIGTPPLPNYSINSATQMVGKTVARVEVGTRRPSPDRHQSEVVVVHFTDGSVMSLDAGCNAGNFDCDKHRPHEFHVDFIVQWVPPPE
jgi:hypothetical protein